MIGLAARIAANMVIFIGLLLFARVIHKALTSALVAELFAQPQGSWALTLFALGLSLPVPFHVVSVGLILQKRRLSPFWAKVAWLAVVTSGCWLGLALGVKLLVL